MRRRTATRGSVQVFNPTYTQADQNDPGKRVTLTSPHYHWRFRLRGRRFQGGLDADRLPYLTAAGALAAGERRKAEVRSGMEEDPHRLTFDALAQILDEESKLLAPATQTNVRACLRHLREYFDGWLVADIRRPELLAYVTFRRGQRAADGSIWLELGKLRTAMGHAHDQRRLVFIPRFPTMPTPRRQQRARPDLLAALIAALPEHYRRFFQAADEIAWRAKSELRTRRWTDVDFAEGWVYLDAAASKTRKARVAPMTTYLRTLLEEQRAWVKERERALRRIIPWVFCRPDGRQLAHDYQQAWSRACDKVGIGRIEGRSGPWSRALVPHDIRRTTLARWERDGLPRNATMAAAGHSEERTFSDYVTATPEDLRALARRLDEARAARDVAAPPKIHIKSP